eukprot:GHVR01172802.1.p2 GENE.GHVR01172802.1~~GHVR01172802.1.p2  ORF type:complete len:128 (+),score=58.04 GHVR01172802.1:343-726(+)
MSTTNRPSFLPPPPVSDPTGFRGHRDLLLPSSSPGAYKRRMDGDGRGVEAGATLIPSGGVCDFSAYPNGGENLKKLLCEPNTHTHTHTHTHTNPLTHTDEIRLIQEIAAHKITYLARTILCIKKDST